MLPHRQSIIPSSSVAASTSTVFFDGRQNGQYADSPRSRLDNINAVQHPGHHRDKLDLIRDSLRPFDQSPQDNLNATFIPATSNSAYSAQNGSHSADIQQRMITALTQVGYDKDLAFHALKLVNFKSVTDAARLLHSNGYLPAINGSTSTIAYANDPPRPTVDSYQSNGRNVRAAPLPPQEMPSLAPLSLNTSRSIVSIQQQHLGMTRSLPPSTGTALFTQNNGYPMEMSSVSNGSSTQPDGSCSSSRSESPLTRNASPMTNNPNGAYIGTASVRSTSPMLQRMGAERRLHSPGMAFHKAHIGLKATNSADPDGSSRTPASTRSNGTVIRIDRTESTPASSSSNAFTRRLDVISRNRMPAPSPPVQSETDKYQSPRQQAMRSGVQSITVDPDKSATRRNQYMAEKAPQSKVVNTQVSPIGRSVSSASAIRGSPLGTTHVSVGGDVTSFNAKASYDESNEAEKSKRVVRSVSPLPESVARRLHNKTYEKFVKPCRAPMFRFFMEQHTERLILQYRERNNRAFQLTKEMEAAELADSMKEQMLRLLRQKESKYIRLKRQKMNKNMFDMIRHIGVGAFGKVTLVRKKDTSQIYAMKTLSKEDVIQKQQAAHVKAERDILAEANSQWIVRLYFSFQDAHNLYFIMEYVPGGDMMQLLINKGIFTERLARFYMAELTCALEYVHSLGFIHRDIKPDNILIDKDGHIKLTDFGLCTGLRWTHDKRHYVIYAEDDPSANAVHYRDDSFSLPPNFQNNGRELKLLEFRHNKKRNQAHSVVGTGNYMAPEVILKTGHTQLCDWWSVGVICYEMVYGRPPFLSPNDNPGETQYMIVNWNRYLNLDNPMGRHLSSNCVDFIARLCSDQADRLGANGASEVKAHPWFNSIEFDKLRSKRAEFVPKVEHAEDTSNFDTFEVNSEDFFRRDMPLKQGYNPAFFDFTFRNFFANEGMQGPTSRMQQRPSIAPLIATNMEHGDRSRPSNVRTMAQANTHSSTSRIESGSIASGGVTVQTGSSWQKPHGFNGTSRNSATTTRRYENNITHFEEEESEDEYIR